MKEEIIPDWLNLDFFAKILKQIDPDLNVINYNVTPAVLAGNNYCSRMWRVAVNHTNDSGEKKSTSVMIKAPVPDGLHKEFIDEAKFVEKEYRFYNEVVPIMKKITDNFDILPKTYPTSVPETLVLKDLKDKGYVMCDRLKQLDFDHCSAVMVKLATFHALSVAVNKTNPGLIRDVGKEHIYIAERPLPEPDYIKLCFVGFLEAIKSWEGYDRFDYLLPDKADLFYKKLCKMVNPGQRFNVLNHGDIWTNNMLFKHNKNGEVIDVKLIDFQNCKYTSLGMDLHFFIWSSVQEDVRKNKIEDLKRIYLEVLNLKLEEFGCDERLSKDQLEKELEFTSIIAVFILFVMLPLILADPEDNIHEKIGNLDKDSPPLSMPQYYTGKYYVPVASKILIELEETFYDVFCKP